MTTFAQALARIEELQREVEKLPLYTWSDDCEELSGLLFDHADSIVQLGKIAERMHEFILYTQCYDSCIDDYNKLIKGE